MTEIALNEAMVSRYGPNDELRSEFTKGKTFLPRIEFKSGSTAICKSKKFPIDHYALVEGKELYDMGESFPALFLSYRYKAIDFTEKGKVRVAYDPRSVEFKAIQAIADGPKKDGQLSGAIYGPEFLIAAKRPDSIVVLATVLCGTASWKAAARTMFGFVDPRRRFGSFGSKLVEGKYTYMAPVVSAFGGSFPLDDIPNLTEEITTFVTASGTAEQDAEPTDENVTVVTNTDRAR